jgi:hypothetical protein
VQRYDRTHLIPLEDRKRELIAAHHTARVKRLYGTVQGKQPASGQPPVLPVYLSADEVIGLIAYDRTTALSEPAPGAPPIFERWKSHLTGGSTDERQYPLVRDMRLVLSRVRWWQLRKRERAGSAKCSIKPLDQIARGHVRWALRSHQRTAVETIALLRSDVRLLLAAQTSHEIAIERATAILCTEIAAEHIVAFGRPGVWRTRRFKGGIHEPIPSVFFANPNNTIMADGWATCGWDATTQDWADWTGPDWGDIRFRRDDVLALLRCLFGDAEHHAGNLRTSQTHTVRSQGSDPVVSMMQFEHGYVSPYFITNAEQKTTELDQPFILIHEEKLSYLQPLLPLLERIVQSGRPLLIVAEDVEGEALATLVVNKRRGGIKVAAVRVPGIGNYREAILENIATLTGGLVINASLGTKLENVTLTMLGSATRVVIEKHRTTIIGGAGKSITVTAVAPAQQAGFPSERTRLAIPNRPGSGGKKTAAATEAMVKAVQEGQVPLYTLKRMKQKELECLYPEAQRTTLTQAREAALARLHDAGYPDKAPT